ncbi:MAG: glycine cleavage system protein GcvH [Anaerofustis sp.]
MNYPNNLKYTSDHVWVKVDGDKVIVGITDFAQDQLGDVLYVDLPAEGDTFAKGEVFSEVESSKTASELQLPFAGEVLKVNEDLDDSPELLNEDSYTNWIAEFKADDLSEIDALMSSADYEASL